MLEADRSALSCALAYINRGWHVLPLNPRAKHPFGAMVPNGVHGATNNPEQARAWWEKCPDAGVGIALKASGLVAVDVDPRNGGMETLERLEAQHGQMQSDVYAFTGGGGMHFVYQAQVVEALPGTLGPGIDLKKDGYIVAEPSIHPSGRAYQWEASSDPLEGCVPTALPGWIRDLARAPFHAAPSAAVAVPPLAPERRTSLLDALQHVDADSRDNWLQVGMAINNEMPGADGFQVWDAWSRQSSKYDAQDQMRVWRSFKPRGLAGVGLNSVFKMAQETGWRNSGAPLASEPQKAGLPILNIAQLEQASAAVTWAVKHVIPSDSVGVMFGASGTFKSFLALDFALHSLHGMQWLGKKTKRGPVLFIAAEGGSGIWRRVKAWHMVRGLDWRGIEFYVVPLAVMLNKGADQVVEAAQRVGVTPATVIVDTLSQTFEGEENSANEVAGYFRALGNGFRALWRCVVLVIHHSGHVATERPRGSSAIVANVDFMLGVFRDEKELIATMTCEKQKDGDRFEPVQFQLTSKTVDWDEDGEAVTSLAAHHLQTAEALLKAKEQEASAGRAGRDLQLLACATDGIPEKTLRLRFYGVLPPEMDMHAKKVAYYRARDQLVKLGRLDFGSEQGSTERIVILL